MDFSRRNFIRKASLATAGGFIIPNQSSFLFGAKKHEVKDRFNASFVKISEINPYFFELSNGEPYIPVGANICWAKDMNLLEQYMSKLSENSGNYVRIWLSYPMFDVDPQLDKVVDDDAFANLDRVFELALKYKIKLKLCLEHFRQVKPEKDFNTKSHYHKDNGGALSDMQNYVNSDKGKELYLDRAKLFQKRYGNNPVVFGWELWNEMNAINSTADSIIEWNKFMLPEIHKLFPENMVMQSLGSFDSEKARYVYRAIDRLQANDVAQVHRYLDPGASLDVCTAPMDVIASNAIEELKGFQIEKPMILSEVGAVRAHHAGPSELYQVDKEGMLLHDMLFAPFFSGSAGSGMPWHWDNYIDRNNLWYHFERFRQCIKGINPIQEGLVPVKLAHKRLRIYILMGQNTILGWCRDVQNNWQNELVQNIAPELLKDIDNDLSSLIKSPNVKELEFYDPWNNSFKKGKPSSILKLPEFMRSLVFKIKVVS